ncbi:MAG: hypothetical protein JWO95_1431 [Verrucomicrobiales bacterium]|nr:hypothetical protein [Verrucomicrobiales bacterium]
MSEEAQNSIIAESTPTPPPGQEPSNVPAQSAEVVSNPQPKAPVKPRKPRSNCRRTGKVACLPYSARQCVSNLLYEGKTYQEIIAFLEDEGFTGITRQNITNWARGGHKDWLQQQVQLETIVTKRGNMIDLTFALGRNRDRHFDLTDVNNALLASRYNEVLQQIDSKQIATAITANPELLFRLAAEESDRQKRETDVIRDREEYQDRKRRREQADFAMRYEMLGEKTKAELREAKGKPGYHQKLCQIMGVKVPEGTDLAKYDQRLANS